MNGKLAIIGGSGLMELEGLEVISREVVDTPWGKASAPVAVGHIDGKEILFLSRHGETHRIPPHMINFRANIKTLHTLGADRIIAVGVVGGITSPYRTGSISIPNQIIDYTWSRQHSFYEQNLDRVVHVDFTQPYCEQLRQTLLQAAKHAGVDVIARGTYGAMQGPRFETAAEIERMARDGCDIVGMTGMPEAVLARELSLLYAHCTLVVNPAAGRYEEPIMQDQIEKYLVSGMVKVRTLLRSAISLS